MVCVVIIFDLDDPPEIHALSVPQYVWSKDLVRDVHMDGVCRDPRFDCFLRHGLLEMPTLVAWQPYQGMKLNLDIKILSCERRVPGYSIMTTQESVIDDYGLEERDEDAVFLMQQQASLGSESEMPSTPSTHRNDTESLCNGYVSRGPTDVAPHFTNQAQQLEELREWLLELLGSDTSITLYVFERNDGDVATYRISIRAEVLRGGPGFAHWIRRELAALWNVHARIFPLVPAPFADLRIAVLLPRAFGRDLPILLEINDGHDSWREIHVVQQGVTINSLLWRSRLPQVVPSTQVYQAMLVGETAEPNDLVPWSPGQWVTIAVGQLGHLGGNATTDSFPDPWLPSLTSLATSRAESSRNDEQTGDPSQVDNWIGGDEHTLMQWSALGHPQPNEICTWLLKWEQRDLIQEQTRIIRVSSSQDFHAQILQVWRDDCEVDCPWVIPISLHIQQAGIQVPAFFVLDYISPLYRPVFVDLEALDFEVQGGFLLRDPQVLSTNDIFDQVLPSHRCRSIADCFVWKDGHWYEWDEILSVNEGDYLQLLEYTESEDEHSTLCGSGRETDSHVTEEDNTTDDLSLLQRETWHREAWSGLPPPGNGVFWESKCLETMDDLIHCHDGDHVVDFIPIAQNRPIPTPARSKTLPKVVSINDALTASNGLELKLPLGIGDQELERYLDFDPVDEQLETAFNLGDLDEQLQQAFQAVPKCEPDDCDPSVYDSVRIYTDGSFAEGSATWNFVIVACWKGQNFFIGFRSGFIPLHGHVERLLDSHGSAVCAEQHAIIWATWWLLCYWRVANVTTPVVFLWDSQVAGRQAEGVYGLSTDLGRLLRGLQIALQQLTEADVGHLHVPAHQGHLYNEIADALAKQAHRKCPTCPDNGRLLQLTDVLGNLDHLWLMLTSSSVFPKRSGGYFRWWSDSETVFPKELLSHQLLPEARQKNDYVSTPCYLQMASYNALSLMGDKGCQTLYAEQGRVQLMRQQFEVRGMHIVGIQEARTPQGILVSHSHIRFCSGKTDGGQYGVELWISRSSRIADGLAFHPGEFLVALAEPRLLIVKYRGQLGELCFLVAHAPHTAADLLERQQWWGRLQKQFSTNVGGLECVVFIDANATAPCEATQSFGGLTWDHPNKNTPLFEEFVTQNGLFAPSTFEDLQYGPPETWTHSATGKKSRD